MLKLEDRQSDPVTDKSRIIFGTVMGSLSFLACVMNGFVLYLMKRKSSELRNKYALSFCG